jgi:hypothetical protein
LPEPQRPFSFEGDGFDSSDIDSIEDYQGDGTEGGLDGAGSDEEEGLEGEVPDTSSESEAENSSDLPFFAIPECVINLRNELRNGYMYHRQKVRALPNTWFS